VLDRSGSNHPVVLTYDPGVAEVEPILRRDNCLDEMDRVTVTFGYFRPLTLALELLRSKSNKSG
jgi:hypothetical protein